MKIRRPWRIFILEVLLRKTSSEAFGFCRGNSGIHAAREIRRPWRKRGEMREKRVRLTFYYFVTGIAALFSGIAVYMFFRNANDMVLFRFVPKPAFLNSLFIPIKNDSLARSVFLYNLPDGLWFLSGVLFLRALWNEKPKTFLVYKLCFISAAFLLEILQVFDGIAGTFDLLDILFMGIFAFLESVIFNLFIKRRIA